MSKPDSITLALSRRLLSRLEPWCAAGAWRVAFSGGLDSTVLLHLLAELARVHPLPPLTAVHVNHGLQAVAASWPVHCRQMCQILGVPMQVIDVQVRPGASLEQAARDARYTAFNSTLAAGEVLLTAQHRDDQAETLLFRLLRGAGVAFLADPAIALSLLIVGSSGVIAIILPYTAERYPLRIRGGATGWVAGCSKLGGLLAQGLTAAGAVPPLGLAAGLIAVPAVLALVLISLLGKETRGRDLSEMD